MIIKKLLYTDAQRGPAREEIDRIHLLPGGWTDDGALHYLASAGVPEWANWAQITVDIEPEEIEQIKRLIAEREATRE